MKRISLILSALFVMVAATSSWAVNKETIASNVDSIVAMIESGKDANSIKADSVNPYAFVMEIDGKMLVHPSLTGQSLKEKAPPVYTALLQANPHGIWVQYEWNGKIKHSYVKMTKNNLIVGSGY